MAPLVDTSFRGNTFRYTTFRCLTGSFTTLLSTLAFVSCAALLGVDVHAAVDVTFTPLVAMRPVADGVFVHDGAAIGVARNGLSLRAFENECNTRGTFHTIDEERALCVIQQQGKNGPVWLVSATRAIPGDTDTLTMTMSTSAGDDERAALVGGVVRALLDRCFRFTPAAEARGRLVIGASVEDCVEPSVATATEVSRPSAPSRPSSVATSRATHPIVDKFKKSKGRFPSARTGLSDAL